MRVPRPAARWLVLLAALAISGGCSAFEQTSDAADARRASEIRALIARHQLATSAVEATEQGSSPTLEPKQKVEAPATASSSSETVSEPSPPPVSFDPAVFVGRGSAAGAPDGFARYPRTLKRSDLPALGAQEDSADEDGPDPLVEVYPDGAMYERVRIYFGKAATPSSITIRFFASDDPRRALLDLRAALEKRYGKGTLRPDGATEDDFDRVLWRSPRMRLDLDVDNIELELMY